MSPGRDHDYQVCLLGRFRLTVDGRPVDGPMTARLQSLFAYLLLHADAPQPRAHLSFTFWPDASESNGRNNLRQLLHQLRQALPDPDRYLRADANSVQWAPDSSFGLDAALFDRAVAEAEAAGRAGDAAHHRTCLERAVDLCQGPLLPSCYDDWIGPVRERLARRCEEAVAALVGLLEEQREYASAIARVRHWLQHDPLDEEACRWLMRLLALTGDRVAALQAYRQHADALQRELAAEPSPATVRTYERIRDAAPDPPAPSGGQERTPAASSLVGRQTEWSRLREAWERAVLGRASVALVTGDAGIGKSRLAEELLTWAQRQGVTTAKTRSYAAEGRLSLAPVSEWLRSDALSPHLAGLEDVWRVEVARILPELLTARPDLPRPAPMTEFGDRLRFFEGLARAVLAAPPPLLLLIDDLQWCDRETLEWLHFLSRFDPEARLLVLATARSEELDAAHPLPTLLRHLRGASQLAEIALEPFDAAETAELAAQVGNRVFDADAATRLYRETEGNPLFVVETVRAEGGSGSSSSVPEQGIAGLPPRAHAVMAGRLAQLSDDTREVAATASVIGRAFDLSVLVRLVGDEEVVARALDELWRKRIVREQGPNVYDFTHDKLRDVAYGETSAPQKRRLHRRVAEALATAHEKDLDPVSAQIAAHYENAGLFEQAIPYCSRAAVVAQGVYAHDEAIALAGRGLSLLKEMPASARRDGGELELQLVLAPSYRVTLGWAAPELGRVLDRALALCDRVGTPAQRAEILYGLQSRYIVEGRLEKSALTTDEMVRVFRETEGSEPPRSAFAMLAGVRLQMGRFQEAGNDIEDLVREADPSQLQRLQESQGLELRGPRASLAVARAVVPRSSGRGSRGCNSRPDTRPAGRSAVQPGHCRHLSGSPPAAARRSGDVPRAGGGGARARHGVQGDLLPGLGRHPRRLRGDARSSGGARSRASSELHRGLHGDGGAAAPAVLPRPAGRRAPEGRRRDRRPRPRGGGPVSRSGDERALVGRGAPSPARGAARPQRCGGGRGGSGASARPRDRAGTAGKVPGAARRAHTGSLVGGVGPDRRGPRPAGARLLLLHGRPRDPRPAGRPRLAFHPRLSAGGGVDAPANAALTPGA